MSEFVKTLPGDQGTFGDVYQDCPVFDDGNYCLRLVAESDAEDLLKVYSDEKASPTAKARIQALAALGYEESEHALAGHDGTRYKYYCVLSRI